MSAKNMRRADLVFEIGCEELPAGMIAKAAAEFKAILEKYLSTENLLEKSSIEVFGGPRRLTAICEDLRTQQPDDVREVTGPPKSVAYDNVGQPTRAAVSFSEKQGVALTDTYIVSTNRGEFLAAKLHTKGRSAEAILAELLPRAVFEIPWPRAMYWAGRDGARFIRPIRWVVAIFGGKILKVTIAGVAAGAESHGHRFLGKSSVVIRGAADYASALKKSFVIVHPEERRKKIQTELARAAAKHGLKIHADAGLLEMVTYLNEFPTVIVGNFDSEFLDLPEEILVTVMRDHQKYFAMETRSGALAPHFCAAINLDRDSQGLVQAGHERVLRARFADARFFWEADQRHPLAAYMPRLKQVTYQAKLGSYFDKVERMREVSRWLADQWFAAGVTQASPANADRAAELSKCDLPTGMVGEFPELQGIVGGLYAEAQGEPEEISRAIYDQYKPAGIDDQIPGNLTGCILSLADKFDAIVGCLAAGLLPTGSSDPFGLRRAALGVVKIILEKKNPVSLSGITAATAKSLGAHAPHLQVKPETVKQILDFILERARFVLRERLGYAYDEVNATFAAGADDLVDAVHRLEALKAIRKSKNFEPLAVSFKRIRKIIEKAGAAEGWRLPGVQPELLEHAAERNLHEQARAAAKSVATHKRSGKYREALQAIAEMRPAVDKFFDEVLVMSENDAVRRNRLTLLAELLSEFSTIADFSELGASEKGA